MRTNLFCTALILLNLNTQPDLRAVDPAAFAAQQRVAAMADEVPDTFGRAKNIILFLGDGMGGIDGDSSADFGGAAARHAG